jgi:hypothetical protein
MPFLDNQLILDPRAAVTGADTAMAAISAGCGGGFGARLDGAAGERWAGVAEACPPV